MNRSKWVALLCVAGFSACVTALVGGPSTAAPQTPSDATCTSTWIGDYAKPKGIKPLFVGDGLGSRDDDSNPKYRLSIAGTGPYTLTVKRTSDNQTVLTTQAAGFNTSWGFSPDQDGFLVTEAGNGITDPYAFRLYDLSAGGALRLQENTNDHDLRVGWSPHGEYFVYDAMAQNSQDQIVLRIYDAGSGDLRYQTTARFVINPTAGNKDFHGAGWGFSPDDDEFVLTWVESAPQGVAYVLADLDAGRQRYSGTFAHDGWPLFSPRGDYLAVVQQWNPNSTDITLLGTHADSQILTTWQGDAVATTTLASTTTGEQVTFGDNTYSLLDHRAPDPDVCPPTWADNAALTAGEPTENSVPLTWPLDAATGAEDDTEVTGYRVFRRESGDDDWDQIAELAADDLADLDPEGEPLYEATGLTDATDYDFKVEAGDALDHWSADGPTAAATTATSHVTWEADTELSFTDVTDRTVRLSWPAPRSACSDVTALRISRDGEQIAQIAPSTTTYLAGDLDFWTRYSFTVESVGGECSGELSGSVLTDVPEGYAAGRWGIDSNQNGILDGGEGLDGVGIFTALSVDDQHRVLSHHQVFNRPGGYYAFATEGTETFVNVTLGFGEIDWSTGGFKTLYPAFVAPDATDFYSVGDNSQTDPKKLDFIAYYTGWTTFDPAYGSGTISGTIFDDRNANGVQDAGEPGIADKPVYCGSIGGAATTTNNCQATTNETGDFTLTVRNRIVTMDRSPGYLWPTGSTWYPTSQADKAWGVHYGDSYDDADFGYVHGDNTLTGRVAEDWNHDDVAGPDEFGAAADRIGSTHLQVCAAGEQTGYNKCSYIAEDGSWSLADAPPDNYRVFRQHYGSDGYWTGGDIDEVPVVPVTGHNASAGLGTLLLDPTYAAISGQVWNDADRDGIADDEENWLEGMSVCGRLGPAGEGATTACGSAGSDGTYTVALPAGDVTLHAELWNAHDEVVVPADNAWTRTVASGERIDGADFGIWLAPVPSRPANLTATLDDGRLEVDWDPADAPDEYPVTSYDVSWFNADFTAYGTCRIDTPVDDELPTSCTLTDARLDGSKDVFVYVTASNTNGSGVSAAIIWPADGTDPTDPTPEPTDPTPDPTDTTPTPTDPTPDPTETTPSPTQTTPSPTQTTPSPTDTTPTPTDPTPEPTDSTATPTDPTPEPTDTTPSPTETTPSPTETTPSPTQTTPSPTETTPSPTQTTTDTPTSEPTADGTISVAAGAVNGGEAQTVTATGFEPGEDVDATLHSTPVHLGTYRADATGKVQFTFSVPETIEPGRHSVTLVGRSSGHTASASFTVNATAGGADHGGDLPGTGGPGYTSVMWAIVLGTVGIATLVVEHRRRQT